MRRRSKNASTPVVTTIGRTNARRPLGEPRDLTIPLLEALKTAFGSRLRAVILAGSVAKDDWIPNWSDLDVHVFVEDSDALLRNADSVELHRVLSSIDRRRYQIGAIQILLFDAKGYPPSFGLPAPGTFELLSGILPDSLLSGAPDKDYLDRASDNMTTIGPRALRAVGALISASEEELATVARQVAGIVKDAVNAAAVLTTASPASAFGLRRRELLDAVGTHLGNEAELTAFYAFVNDWENTRSDSEALRRMFMAGLRALGSFLRWDTSRSDPHHLGRTVADARRARMTQADLAEATASRGTPVDEETIGSIESHKNPYPLPRKRRSGFLAIEAVAQTLEIELVDLLLWRDDSEVRASCFASLLPEVRRRRALHHDR